MGSKKKRMLDDVLSDDEDEVVNINVVSQESILKDLDNFKID